MMTKPMKTLQLHYPMIQFLIKNNIECTTISLSFSALCPLKRPFWIPTISYCDKGLLMHCDKLYKPPPPPHYPSGIWKRSFHTTESVTKTELFENGLQTGGKTPALRLTFSADGKHFEEAFEKRCRFGNHVISLPEVSANHKSKMAGYGCVFKFLWSSVDGNIYAFSQCILRFQIPPA